jgi:hypothetical protein
MSKNETFCPDCDSKFYGFFPPVQGNGVCGVCKGTGESWSVIGDLVDEFTGSTPDPCPSCNGNRQCQTCGGTGMIYEEEEDIIVDSPSIETVSDSVGQTPVKTTYTIDVDGPDIDIGSSADSKPITGNIIAFFVIAIFVVGLISYFKDNTTRTNYSAPQTQNGVPYLVIANSNIRSSTSKNSQIIAKFNKGEYVTIIDSSNSNWFQVKVSTGVGFIYSDLLSRYNSTKSIKNWIHISTKSKNATKTTGNKIAEPPKFNIVECKRCVKHGSFGNVDTIITCTTCIGEKSSICSNCSGQGTNTCKKCNGQKTVVCYKCNGQKNFDCGFCSGSRSRTCSNCNGTGGLMGRYGMTNCNVCAGRGLLKCNMCGATGKIACNGCGQVGYLSCNSCINGSLSCHHCGGFGKINCHKCKGYGILQARAKCPVCKGEGVVKVPI